MQRAVFNVSKHCVQTKYIFFNNNYVCWSPMIELYSEVMLRLANGSPRTSAPPSIRVHRETTQGVRNSVEGRG